VLASSTKDTKAGNAAVNALTSVWEWFVEYALTIGLTIGFSLLLWWICIRVIRRVTEQAKKRLRQDRPGQARAAEHTQELTAVLMTARREQRAEALGQLMRSIVTFTIFGLGILVVLAQAGVNLTPILASAGVVGVALGFGAQTLVKDFLSGVFLVLEDQFGVGDVVDLGPLVPVGWVEGRVEEVTLRVTKVRTFDGDLFTIANGQLRQTMNLSRDWSRVLITVPVSREADLDATIDMLNRIGSDIARDPEWAPLILEAPSVLGVDDIAAETYDLRFSGRTLAAQQWKVAREIRRRIAMEGAP